MSATNMDIRQRALAWQAKKDQLDIAKQAELDDRAAISRDFFPIKKLGVNSVIMDNDHTLKLTHKENIKFTPDKDKLAMLWEQLVVLGKTEAVNGMFVPTVELNKTIYKALPDDVRKIVNATGMITITDATLALEIVNKPKARQF